MSIFLFFADTCQAVKVSGSHKLEQTQLWIALKWPEPIKFTATVGNQNLIPMQYVGKGRPRRHLSKANTSLSGRKLIFRFDRAIDAHAIANLTKNVPDWIEDTYIGFDSIAIETQSSANFELYQKSNKVFIKVSALMSLKEEQGDEELRHLESSLFSRKPKFKAHWELIQFQKKYPNDPQIMADLADIEGQMGRWREAIDLYAKSWELRPGNRELYLSRSNLQEEFGPQVRLEQYYQDTSNEEIQWVTRVLARQTFFKNYLLGVEYENRVIDDNEDRPRLDGTSRVFEGNRDRWQIFSERAHGFAHTRFSILGQEDEIGAALQHRMELSVGKLFLRGSYNEPYWELLEGLIDEGTVSRLQALYSYEQPKPFVVRDKEQGYFSGLLGMSLNRYGVEDRNYVAGSIAFLGELRYHLSQILSGLSFGYSLNFEYINITDTRIDADGDNFNPLPLEDIRNHAWDISLSQMLSSKWRYDLSTGYNLDSRTQDSGPFVVFNLIRDSMSNLQVGFNFEINQELNRGENNSFTKVGAFLLWKL